MGWSSVCHTDTGPRRRKEIIGKPKQCDADLIVTAPTGIQEALGIDLVSDLSSHVREVRPAVAPSIASLHILSMRLNIRNIEENSFYQWSQSKPHEFSNTSRCMEAE